MLFRRKKPATWSGKLREFLWPRKGFSRGLALSVDARAQAVVLAAFDSGRRCCRCRFLGNPVCRLSHSHRAGSRLSVVRQSDRGRHIDGACQSADHPVHSCGDLRARPASCLGPRGTAPWPVRTFSTCWGISNSPILWEPVLKPMLIGSVPLAAASAVVFYVAAFYAAKLFQSRRQAERCRHVQVAAGWADDL